MLQIVKSIRSQYFGWLEVTYFWKTECRVGGA